MRKGDVRGGIDGGAAAAGRMIRLMRFSRHARNEMRLYRLAREDVEVVVAFPQERGADERGNVRLVGEVSDGRRILVVVADDDPDFVITVFVRS